MTRLSDLAKGVLGEVLQGSTQGQNLQAGFMDLLEQSGGLQGLVDKFQQGGLGDVISSWIGTGANEPVSGEQLDNVLGNDTVSRLAAKLGFDPESGGSQLASLLPKVIDLLTPDGQVPEQPDFAQVLGKLFKR